MIRKKLRIFAVIAALLPMMFLTSCGDTENSGKLSIVTTIFPPYDFAREITGGECDIQILLKPGQESHSYEPTIKDILAIENCDLFIYTGGESDVWVEDMLASFDEPVNALRLVDLCDVKEEEEIGEEHDHEEEHSVDEHVWTSLRNAQDICGGICDAVCAIDSENADEYQKKCDAYCEKLKQLDGEFTRVVNGGKRQTLVFGDRFPFRYLADDYGLECFAAFSGCSDETEPSAATFAYLIDKIESEDLPVVLYIEFSAENAARAIAEQTGCDARLFHSCHNVTQEEMDNGVSYISLMEENLQVLKEALY